MSSIFWNVFEKIKEKYAFICVYHFLSVPLRRKRKKKGFDMSAAQAILSRQFIDEMGPMASDAKVVDQVFSYIRLMRVTSEATQQLEPYSMDEIDARLTQAESSFVAGEGIPEVISRQHRHAFVNQLIAR